MSGSRSKKPIGKGREKPAGKLSSQLTVGGISRYNKVNFLFIIFFLISLILSFFKDEGGIDAKDLLPYLVFISIFLLFIVLKDKRSTRIFQILILFFLAVFIIVTNTVIYQVGYILFLFVYFLTLKHNLAQKRRTLFNFVSVCLLIASIYMSTILTPLDEAFVIDDITIWHILDQINFLITTFALIFIVFEEDFKKLTQVNQELNKQIEKSSVFVNLGENISGLIHNMNGDLGLLSLSVSMLEEEVDHKAIGFIKTGNKKLQAKIRNILTLAKYSQAIEEMEFSVNALLYSILEIYNINKEYKDVQVETDFNDEVFFYANPSEISQVFENLIKNAYEALLEKKKGLEGNSNIGFNPHLNVIIKGYRSESHVIFEDNGPGIKACLDRDCHGQCYVCEVFQIGRTTKTNGTGLGMISVLRTLKKYECDLRIETTVEGSSLSVIFPRK